MDIFKHCLVNFEHHRIRSFKPHHYIRNFRNHIKLIEFDQSVSQSSANLAQEHTGWRNRWRRDWWNCSDWRHHHWSHFRSSKKEECRSPSKWFCPGATNYTLSPRASRCSNSDSASASNTVLQCWLSSAREDASRGCWARESILLRQWAN